MNLKNALFAIATAGAFLLFAACGGDGGQLQVGSASDSTQSQPTTDAGSLGGSSTGGSTSSGGDNATNGTTAKYAAIDLLSSAGGSGIGDGEQVGDGRIPGSREIHALLWRGSASSVVDLGSFAEAGGVLATSGGIQVGWYGTDDYDHALKWAGSASSVVDIHPGGVFRESKAVGIAGDQVIGYGLTYTEMHALLWTSRGVVDLNPPGFADSSGTATDGSQQVGYGARTAPIGLGAAINGNHALLWRGTADSAVDLHPASGYDATSANGVGGGQQVGSGGAFFTANAWSHALLWTGSAESVVDLHPGGFRDTAALAVANARQVGWGTTTDGSTHALLWNGTAESVVDLHVFLPSGFTRSSASGIDASGNIIGSATDGQGVWHAILWVPQ